MSENSSPQYDRLDSNGLLYVFQRLKVIFGGLFVGKETGKGLSTNDYTTAEKEKLSGIAAGAQVNVIAGIQRNGTDLTPDANKKVNVEVPVLTVQRNGTDLTPDANKKVNIEAVTGITMNGAAKEVGSGGVVDLGTVITSHQSLSSYAKKASPAFTGTPTAPTAAAGTNTTQIATTAFVKTAIDTALSGKIDLQFSFLQQLPATGVVGTFYFIPAAVGQTGVDEWEEYVWDATNSVFERIGAATLDLTDYFNTTNLPAITNAQIDAILAN